MGSSHSSVFPAGFELPLPRRGDDRRRACRHDLCIGRITDGTGHHLGFDGVRGAGGGRRNYVISCDPKEQSLAVLEAIERRIDLATLGAEAIPISAGAVYRTTP